MTPIPKPATILNKPEKNEENRHGILCIAVSTNEAELLDGKIVGIVENEAEAITVCKTAGFNVIMPDRGGDISTYNYGDAPTARFLKEDEQHMGCIFVTVEPQEIAA